MLKLKTLVAAMLCASVAFGAATLTEETDFNDWGWGMAYVLSNDVASVAVMPAIGGRPLKYQLTRNNQSLLYHDWMAASDWGSLPDPLTSKDWATGMQTWPVPQDNWKNSEGATKKWPPPPQISNGIYTAEVLANTADSVSILVVSPVETDRTIGLQLKKIFTLYDNSTRVRIEQHLINTNAETQSWSLRLVSQCWSVGEFGQQYTVDNPDMWCYFPKGVSENDGTDGYWLAGSYSPTEVSPGVLEVHYDGETQSGLRTHPDKQWLALVETKSAQGFFQTGEYSADAVYPEYGATNPDKGAVIIIWDADSYYEMELCTPESTIVANDSAIFVNNWYTATVTGPIIDVNTVGAIKENLAVDAAGLVSGHYGVFYEGSAKLFVSGAQTTAAEWTITPSDSFVINETVAAAAGVQGAALHVYDKNGNHIGILDTFGDQSNVAVQRRLVASATQPAAITVAGNMVTVTTPDAANARLTLTTFDGRVMFTKSGLSANKTMLDLNNLAAGSYLVAVSGNGYRQAQKVVVRR